MKKHRWVFTSASLDTALSELKKNDIKFLDFKRGREHHGSNARSGYYFKIMTDAETSAKLGWKESK